MATSGPGATNLVTGIATAYMDSIPLVAITANVGTALLGKDSFQEIDIAGVTMPITKYSMIIKNVKDLAPRPSARRSALRRPAVQALFCWILPRMSPERCANTFQ